MESEDWLKSLAVGQKVIISTGNVYRGERLATVDRLTATQIVVGEHRFKRDSGWMIGGSRWETTWLQEPTPERLKLIALRKAVAELKHEAWEELDQAVVFQVVRILREHKQPPAVGAVDPVGERVTG